LSSTRYVNRARAGAHCLPNPDDSLSCVPADMAYAPSLDRLEPDLPPESWASGYTLEGRQIDHDRRPTRPPRRPRDQFPLSAPKTSGSRSRTSVGTVSAWSELSDFRAPSTGFNQDCSSSVSSGCLHVRVRLFLPISHRFHRYSMHTRGIGRGRGRDRRSALRSVHVVCAGQGFHALERRTALLRRNGSPHGATKVRGRSALRGSWLCWMRAGLWETYRPSRGGRISGSRG
jgi:hypothetical protein